MATMRRSRHVACYLAAVLLIPGCGGESAGRDGVDVSPLELTDELRIGSPDDPEQSFRWFGELAVDPEGRVYTLHFQSQLIRVHDENGRLVRKIGGEGEGPGEFKSARSMGFLGDTLWVFDGGTYRFTCFDIGTGDLIESVRAPVDFGDGPDDSPPRPAGLLPDGSVLGQFETSQRTRILAATAYRVWGVTSDELDVPYIVRYDLKPAGPDQDMAE
jgi:hypothetical protein